VSNLIHEKTKQLDSRINENSRERSSSKDDDYNNLSNENKPKKQNYIKS